MASGWVVLKPIPPSCQLHHLGRKKMVIYCDSLLITKHSRGNFTALKDHQEKPPMEGFEPIGSLMVFPSTSGDRKNPTKDSDQLQKKREECKVDEIFQPRICVFLLEWLMFFSFLSEKKMSFFVGFKTIQQKLCFAPFKFSRRPPGETRTPREVLYNEK